jgi:hypothetical protein
VEYHGLASTTIETCRLLTLFCCCQILSVSRPTQNCRGLWVELGVEYHGLASGTIETCGLLTLFCCCQILSVSRPTPNGRAGCGVSWSCLRHHRDLRIINPVLLLSDPVCIPAHPELSRAVGGAGCGVPRPRLRHHRDLRPQPGRGAGGGRCCSSQGSPRGEAGCAALSGR